MMQLSSVESPVRSRRLVADVATERVRRIRGIDDDAAAADDVRRLNEKPPLRMRVVYGKVLAHGDSASDLRLLQWFL